MAQRIIVVGGVHKGAGKTTLACFLLKHLPGWGALKVTTTHEGVICPVDAACTTCGEVRGPYELLLDPAVLLRAATDTWKMTRAGASGVAWLRATPPHLAEGLRAGLEALAGLPGVVVEGTNAARCLDGVYLLAARPPVRRIKPSARDTAGRVDLPVLNLPPGWLGGGTDLLAQELPAFRGEAAHPFRGADEGAGDNLRLLDEVRRRLDLPPA